MQNKEKNYLFLILSHFLLGVLVFNAPILSKVYSFLIVVIGLLVIVKKQNKGEEVLYVCAYIVGSEVFLRMTNGNPNHEFAKYSIMFFFVLGYIYSGITKVALPYILFLILLIPGIIVATESLDLFVDFRKRIAFNLSGSICLAIAALYTFGRKVDIEQVGSVLLVLALPIIPAAVYTQLFTPNIKEVLTSTASNSDLSGGFGPNQVATLFGLGMFIFFSRILLHSRTKIIFIINLLVTFYLGYRGLLTFSRGGMITGFVMILIFIFFVYKYSKSKVIINYFVGVFIILSLIIWSYTSVITDGLIDKRYAGKNAAGVEKQDKFSGRGKLVDEEITWFLDNPFFGIGVGKGTDIRTEKYGFLYASHDEITRLLAEHGIFGILALMILFFTPIFYYMGNKEHIYMLCFLVFWFLTINHAAMRTASPAFVYALSLLNVRFVTDEKTSLHRE